MKPMILILAFAFGGAYAQTGNQDQTNTTEFKVYGECGMCKARIEKSLKTDGISSAAWDKERKVLKVEYLPAVIKVEAIHKLVANVGHDTEKEKAEDEVYNKLPDCCKYERPGDKK
jgi:copper chaperone CopZ